MKSLCNKADCIMEHLVETTKTLFTNMGKAEPERPDVTVSGFVATPTGQPLLSHKGPIVKHNGVTLSVLIGLIPVSHCS